MSRRRFFSGIRYMILGVAALFSIFPFYWMIVGATNTSNDIIRGKLSFGKAFSENITRLMEVADLKQVFYNSMKISVLTVVLSLLVTSMAAYGFEKYKSATKAVSYTHLNGFGNRVKKCPNCGYETQEDFEFCPKCGTRF